jgi:hypothetical protein
MMGSINNLNSQSPSAAAEADDLDLKNMFEQEMARAKESEEYNKRAPIPCPHIDRATLLFSFNMQLREMEKPLEEGHVKMRKTWITGL